MYRRIRDLREDRDLLQKDLSAPFCVRRCIPCACHCESVRALVRQSVPPLPPVWRSIPF